MKRLFAFICALVALCAFGCGRSSSSAILDGYESVRQTVFGGGIVFTASVRGGDTAGALADMQNILHALDKEISTSDENSAVFTFNALGADEDYTPEYSSERVPVSKLTYDLVSSALAYNKETDGLFCISTLPLAKLWHVDTAGINAYAYASPSETPAPPSEQDILSVLPACDLSHLICGEQEGAYYLQKTHPKLQIDLGGIAKGYAADLCLRAIRARGVTSALIDIGGNIAVSGRWYKHDTKESVRWDIGVTSPRPSFTGGGTVCALSVAADTTLVTSGDYERYYTALSGGENLRVPHIVNAKTGLPLGVARNDGGAYENKKDYVVSATVIAENSAMADAYATAVCLMEADEGANFLAQKGLGGILMTADGKMLLVDVTEEKSDKTHLTLTDRYDGYRNYETEIWARNAQKK